MRTGKVVLVVLGALATLVGFGLVLGGVALTWAHATQRDDDGFYRTGDHPFTTSGHALTSERVDLHSDVRPGDWTPIDDLGEVEVRLAAVDGGPVFAGIGPARDVEAYLAGVRYDEVVDVTLAPFHVDHRRHDGTATPAAPDGQPFWVASVAGPGTQTLRWDVEPGEWVLVLMNADGSRGVAVEASVGVATGLLLPVGIGMLAVGTVGLVAGAAMLVAGLRREPVAAGTPGPGGPGTAAPVIGGPLPEGPAPGAATTGAWGLGDLPPEGVGTGVAAGTGTRAYPARLDGHLDLPLSRWLWLVKWLLVLPHLVVLGLLWAAVTVLTVVAGVAILFTGRYPRSIFDFNVGVVRWTWRVWFYAMGAFGTDRYPPFSLAPDPDYPADFEVDHPERLSRGLVLVKWWLLALPHYLVVAVFAGGWGFGGDDGGLWVFGRGGLIAVVALVAAVILAVRARYPDELFDFLMGLNRWCYRVLAYVLLMRDEYPPFRFDPGGTDPGHRPAPPDAPPPAEPAAMAGAAGR